MKAALILDEMPKKCIDCEYIFHNEQTDHYICGIPNNHIDIWGREIWTSLWIDKMKRPDWCPLQEVEPVRHERWIRAYDAVLDRSYFVCSYCDYGIMIKQGERYCPNCGAKMDGRWTEVRDER